MFLKSISLTNFRNYKKCNFEFVPGVTVLRGNNAQGKSSFLESIYFLATTKSPRVERDEQLITLGENLLLVGGDIQNECALEIIVQLQDGVTKKKVKMNGLPKRASDYNGNLAAILFSPEDINLVIGSPGQRRYHLDLTLSQIDRQYKKNLSSYESIITRKNKILKGIRDGFAKKDELTFWSGQQILLGGLISAKRQELFNFLNSCKKKFGNFFLQYKPSRVSIERLKEYYAKEVEAATSLIGPHRDDFLFFLGDRDLGIFGSRGEQRTAVLDLKLAEVEYFEKMLGDRPILLLDDIFSELDEEHREHVLGISRFQQTIIAIVDMEEFVNTHLKGKSAIYWVEGGRIHP